MVWQRVRWFRSLADTWAMSVPCFHAAVLNPVRIEGHGGCFGECCGQIPTEMRFAVRLVVVAVPAGLRRLIHGLEHNVCLAGDRLRGEAVSCPAVESLRFASEKKGCCFPREALQRQVLVQVHLEKYWYLICVWNFLEVPVEREGLDCPHECRQRLSPEMCRGAVPAVLMVNQ